MSFPASRKEKRHCDPSRPATVEADTFRSRRGLPRFSMPRFCSSGLRRTIILCHSPEPVISSAFTDCAHSDCPLAALVTEGHLCFFIQYERTHKAERSAHTRHIHRNRQHSRNSFLQIQDIGRS